MKKKIAAFSLSLAVLVSVVCTSAFAAGGRTDGSTSGNPAEHYFYNQLTTQGKNIYDAIVAWYNDPNNDSNMKNGTNSYDLVANKVVEESVVQEYLEGNRTLFNDFAAAKDAFDLEHPEAWYVDSSELSFRVTQGADEKYHAYMGPGKSADYYVKGVTKETVESMTAALDQEIGKIVDGAKSESTTADKVRYVHNAITHSISYRFENECSAGNAGYIRTAYALVTHEGVCEGYVRSFQYAMNKLGIPCVPIHGMQTSGEPEAHMWCAVQLDGAWYVVDPTWDDPVGLNAKGEIIKKENGNGNDGGETETYLLVGQNIVGTNWQPSGYVSTSVTAFNYPEIAPVSYGSGVLEQNGLKVEYANDTMEGDTSTVYHVSFNGDGLVKAAEKGYYFLVKMYDLNADGSMDKFDDWYYCVHGMYQIYGFNENNKFQDDTNPYLGDRDGYMIYNVINCEYIEFAITTKAPPDWQNNMDLFNLGGYYSGDYSDILAETGWLFNKNGSYEQPPYVKNVSPALTSSIAAGQQYTIHIEFTDPLYHPSQESIDKALADEVLAGKIEKAPEAMAQVVGMDYRGMTYSWGMNGGKPHVFSDKPKPQNVRWVCETHPNTNHEGFSGIGADCRLTTLEYEFTSSKQWADDSCQYEFYLTGLVGVKSNKFPNTWSYVFENKYPFWTCPLYSGYRWNLWAQPQVLDNPNDLDFSKMVVEGVDGKTQSLQDLHDSMNLDINDMNGRIVMTVQNIGESRSKTEELAQAISDSKDVNIPEGAVKGSSLYEIDFARICRCTVVETGQSLRLCVGFPPGIDASMSGIVFKAYHFTRDIAGSCIFTSKGESIPKGHEHTGEIYSVEEIPITVTEYGLVITCSKFSPFEIVALDKTEAEKAGLKIDNDRYVILTNDGNGTVTCDTEKTSKAADGEASENSMPAGMVKFEGTETKTFTITPAKDYVLEKVTLGNGQTITNITTGDNNTSTFTLSSDVVTDGSTILKATFVPKSIKEADEKAGQTAVEPKVCSHTKTIVTDSTVEKYQAATCTADGWINGLKCTDCGMVLSEFKVLPKLGHTYVEGVCVRDGVKAPATSDDPTTSDPPASDPPSDGPTPTPTPAPSAPGTSGTPSAPSTPSQSVAVSNPSTANGTVSANISTAKKGDTVTVTSNAKSGYISDAPIVKDKNGNAVAVFKNADGTWSFTMPEGGVTITGSYVTPAQKFGDLSDSGWYREDIAYVVENGLMQGTGDGKFDPSSTTTRGMVMTILARQFGADTTPTGSEAWYQKGMDWAKEAGVSDGSDPEGNITREQLATMLWRFADKPAVTGDLSAYPDAGSVHTDWAGDAMIWAVQTGIIKGSDGKLNPQDNASRVEAAAMLSRFCQNIKR